MRLASSSRLQADGRAAPPYRMKKVYSADTDMCSHAKAFSLSLLQFKPSTNANKI